MKQFQNFSHAIQWAGRRLRTTGFTPESTKWQGIEAPAPMLETLFVNFGCVMKEDVDLLDAEIRPNREWADEHFNERVDGVPWNPPPSSERWPYRRKDYEDVSDQGKFSHTYPERFWPVGPGEPRMGIRYRYGDLDDLISLLLRDPFTRQAYLPVWFPEDTGAVHGGRVPCTLGYWFVVRNGYMHMNYGIRSCDYFRHFRDDIYLAARLMLYLRNRLRQLQHGEFWDSISLGLFTMNIGSLHCWRTETVMLPTTPG